MGMCYTDTVLSQGTLVNGFRNVCQITADLSNLSGALERKDGQSGKTYWYLGFDVCIRFGGTELEAFLEWKEFVSKAHRSVFLLAHQFRELLVLVQ
jgi:hypothetical protein